MARISTSYSLLEDEDCVLLVRADRTFRAAEVTAVTEFTTVEDDEFKAAWASAQLQLERGDAIWAHSLPSPNVLFRKVPTPLTAENKARQVLPSLLDVQLPFNLEEASFGIEAWTKSPDGTLEAAVSAVRNEVLQDELDRLEQRFGATPHVVSHEMLSLIHLDKLDPSFAFEKTHLLVLFRPDHVSALLIENGRPVQIRVRRVEAQGELNLSPLVERLNRGFKHSDGEPIGLTCIGTRIPPEDVLKDFQNALHPEIVMRDVKNPESAVPACLAYDALNAKSRVNLREKNFPHPQSMQADSKTRARERVLLISLCAVFIAACCFWLMSLNAIETQRRLQIMERAQELAPNRRIQPGMELVTIERQLEASQDQRTLIQWMAEGGALPVLNLLFSEDQSDLKFSELFIDHSSIRLTGTGTQSATLVDLESALQNNGWLTTLEQTPVAQGLKFTIQGQK